MGQHERPLLGNEDLLAKILPRLKVVRGPDSRGEYVAWCEFHRDGCGKPPHRPNLSVSVRGFICRACGEKGGLHKLAKQLGLDNPGFREPEATYDYRDGEGRLLYQVVRFEGKRFRQRRPDGNGGWIWNLKGTRRVLYRLPDLLERRGEAVFLVEGEKDADRLAREGILATTSPAGAGNWKHEYGLLLDGRDAVIIPDNDGPGRKHAEQIARSLHGVAGRIRILELAGLPEKGDISDWFKNGGSAEELRSLAEEAKEWPSHAMALAAVDSKEMTDDKKDTKSSRLVALVQSSGVELFHDERGEPYVAVPLPRGRRVISLGSKDLSRWLSRLAWSSMGEALGKDTLSSVLGVLGGIACFEGAERKLHVRIAGTEDAIWVDLDGIRAIRVTAEGWEVIDDPPILFRSFPHQRPLPDPIKGGDPWLITRFMNVKGEESELLLLCYLVTAFVPEIPIPVLAVHGVQGSAKTTLLKIVKAIIDPSAVEVRGGVRDQTEFALAAFQNRAIFFDNLTSLPDWLSDALCRAVTGEGWSKRTLYTDDDSTVLEYRRVIGLSGINLIATRADLLDRSVILGLEPIGPDDRLAEREFHREFESVRPLIVGGLLDALVKAIRTRNDLKLSRLPRMADFALWGAAAAVGLGRESDALVRAYEKNVARQNDAAVEGSSTAQSILELMDSQWVWEGTPGELLGELEKAAGRLRIEVKSKQWPKNPSWMTRRLREVIPNLEVMGVQVLEERQAGGRRITLRKRSDSDVIGDTGANPGQVRQLTLEGE